MGIFASTLHHIEMCDQHVTLDMLEEIQDRPKATMTKIFPQ